MIRPSMARSIHRQPTPAFESWIPLARQVVRTSLRLGWKDVFTIYTYTLTIPLAEALALEARRVGSDTHLTLMTDDLWFTSMQELSTKWLSTASPAEHAIARAETAHIYLGGPADARRMRDIPAEKFEANNLGGDRQHEPRRRRRVRDIDLPIGRLTPERAETYGVRRPIGRSMSRTRRRLRGSCCRSPPKLFASNFSAGMSRMRRASAGPPR